MATLSNAKDNELAAAFTVGANYKLSDNHTYVGMKYINYSIKGPTDTLGIIYDDISASSISLTLGYQF